MKRVRRSVVAASLALVLATISHDRAFAQGSFTYQGRLADSTGVAMPNGPYSIRFSLHDAAAVGTELWSETQFAVSVTSGQFSVGLGAVNPIPPALLQQPLFLEVQADTDGTPGFSPNEIFSPRIPIRRVPLASVADRAGAADTATTATIALDVAPGVNATRIANGSVSNTEFQALNGVTSPIQTQLNVHTADLVAHTNQLILVTTNLATLQANFNAHTASTGNGSHIPAAGVTDAEVAAGANIAWGKIDKTGALPADIGAAAIVHTHDAGDIVSGQLPDARVADNLTISGGTVDGSPVGATTASTGRFTDLSATSTADLSGAPLQGGAPLDFEGATSDANSTTLAVTDPTAPRTITVPDASGTLAVSASAPLALDASGNLTVAGFSGTNTGDVVLDPTADAFLDLTGQTLSADSQGAGTVFAAPPGGGAPTFRALTDADIPDTITITESDTLDTVTGRGASTGHNTTFTGSAAGPALAVGNAALAGPALLASTGDPSGPVIKADNSAPGASAVGLEASTADGTGVFAISGTGTGLHAASGGTAIVAKSSSNASPGMQIETTSGANPSPVIVLQSGPGSANDYLRAQDGNGHLVTALTTTGALNFEGPTKDGVTTTLSPVDPKAPNLILLPSASGTVAVSATAPLGLDASGNLTVTGLSGTNTGDVALDPTADAFLDLTGQTLSADSQGAGTVLAAPPGGGSPTFRALTDADIPDTITITEADTLASVTGRGATTTANSTFSGTGFGPALTAGDVGLAGTGLLAMSGSGVAPAIKGINTTAGAGAIGVEGSSNTAPGLQGNSTSGPGLRANSQTGRALEATTNSTTNPAGIFTSANAAQAAPNLVLHNATASSNDFLRTEDGSGDLVTALNSAGGLVFEGPTKDGITTTLSANDATGGAKTIHLPDASGTVAVSATAPLGLDAAGNLTVTGLSGTNTGDVTLAPSADAFLGITGQQISADSQAGNQVLASPAGGGAPTFRGLTDADIPDNITITEADTLASVTGRGASTAVDSTFLGSGVGATAAITAGQAGVAGNGVVARTGTGLALVGLASGNGTGVFAGSLGGNALNGNSSSGSGVRANSTTGAGVFATSGTGTAGTFRSTDNTSSAPVVTIQSEPGSANLHLQTLDAGNQPIMAIANNGDLVFEGSAHGDGLTTTLHAADPVGSSRTITLPNASGTVAVSASAPLGLDAAGNLTVAGLSGTNTGDQDLAGVTALGATTNDNSTFHGSPGGPALTAGSPGGSEIGLDAYSQDRAAIQATGVDRPGIVTSSINGEGIFASSTNGTAVFGRGNGTTGVYGEDSTGTGVSGYSSKNVGVLGSSGIGHSGLFQAQDPSNIESTLLLRQESTGVSTADLLEAQGAAGEERFAIESDGDLRFEGPVDDGLTTTLHPDNPTGVNSISIPDASGRMAISATAPLSLDALGNMTVAGLSGTNTGDQNLQGVTNLGATTTVNSSFTGTANGPALSAGNNTANGGFVGISAQANQGRAILAQATGAGGIGIEASSNTAGGEGVWARGSGGAHALQATTSSGGGHAVLGSAFGGSSGYFQHVTDTNVAPTLVSRMAPGAPTADLFNALNSTSGLIAALTNTGDWQYEGATVNGVRTTLHVNDPSAGRTINFPDASGTVAVSASAPLSLSGAGNLTVAGLSGTNTGDQDLAGVTALGASTADNTTFKGNGAGPAISAGDASSGYDAIQASSDSGNGVFAVSNQRYALYGRTVDGGAVAGDATGTGIALKGSAQSSFGLYAESQAGVSGYFQSSSAANGNPTIVTRQNGVGAVDLFQARNAADQRMFGVLSTGDLIFDGATTSDARTTTLQPVDPTGANFIRIPDSSGTMAVSASSPITLSGAGDIGLSSNAVTNAHIANRTRTLYIKPNEFTGGGGASSGLSNFSAAAGQGVYTPTLTNGGNPVLSVTFVVPSDFVAGSVPSMALNWATDEGAANRKVFLNFRFDNITAFTTAASVPTLRYTIRQNTTGGANDMESPNPNQGQVISTTFPEGGDAFVGAPTWNPGDVITLTIHRDATNGDDPNNGNVYVWGLKIAYTADM